MKWNCADAEHRQRNVDADFNVRLSISALRSRADVDLDLLPSPILFYAGRT